MLFYCDNDMNRPLFRFYRARPRRRSHARFAWNKASQLSEIEHENDDEDEHDVCVLCPWINDLVRGHRLRHRR